jgi:DNA gyrase subunit A
MPVSGVSVISRNTQGVKLIDMRPGEMVAGAARIAESENGKDELPEGPQAMPDV